MQNLNDRYTSMVLGEQEGAARRIYIEDILCGCTFRISPKSFYQINPIQMGRFYSTAIEQAAVSGDTFLDAYCGVGTIGYSGSGKAWSRKCDWCGSKPDAVTMVPLPTPQKRREKCKILLCGCGRIYVELAREGEKINTVLMDPPRAGNDEAFLYSVCKLAPKLRVVYISCNPGTQARDLRYMVCMAGRSRLSSLWICSPIQTILKPSCHGHDGFNMVCMGEHIHRLDKRDLPAMRNHIPQIPGLCLRVTGNINHPLRS